MTAHFSTSLVQIESARNSADGIAGGYSSAFNIWIDGSVLAHNDNDINGGKWGSFAMINMGADYLLSEKALLGLSFHYDHMTSPTDEDAQLKGNGWLAGPYASFEIGKGVFWNGSLLYGGSSNDIDTLFWDGSFETKRWMADTSIEGEWDLGNATTLTPRLRAVYFTENVEGYTIGNAAGDTITIDGLDAKQFRISIGSEIARSFTLESGATLKPSFAVTGGFAALDGSGAFGTAKAGLSLQTEELWTLDASLLFNIEGEGQKSVGARVAAGRQF
ncbi:autotransporter outer membrane beta-barrel domain-containing protein [Agrobacterium sp. S2]|nr:autotransporter outer membrane beta-barrel domain-containing protein [Agrobacterium sp. S2]